MGHNTFVSYYCDNVPGLRQGLNRFSRELRAEEQNTVTGACNSRSQEAGAEPEFRASLHCFRRPCLRKYKVSRGICINQEHTMPLIQVVVLWFYFVAVK